MTENRHDDLRGEAVGSRIIKKETISMHTKGNISVTSLYCFQYPHERGAGWMGSVQLHKTFKELETGLTSTEDLSDEP